MVTKKTIDKVLTTLRLVNPAKLSKMDTTERFTLILATRQLKKVATDFDEIVKDTHEKMKPDGFDAIVSKVQTKTELTASEQGALTKYNKDVTDCLNIQLNKEVELDFEPLGEEVFGKFIESNDFSVDEIITIQDVIGA